MFIRISLCGLLFALSAAATSSEIGDKRGIVNDLLLAEEREYQAQEETRQANLKARQKPDAAPSEPQPINGGLIIDTLQVKPPPKKPVSDTTLYCVGTYTDSEGRQIVDIYHKGLLNEFRIGDTLPTGGKVKAVSGNTVTVTTAKGKSQRLYVTSVAAIEKSMDGGVRESLRLQGGVPGGH